LPLAENRVTLAEEKDRHGLPVAHFAYSQCDNDKQLLRAAQQTMEQILHAAGAQEVMTITRNAHLVGGARMAARAEDGVVDTEHRVFGVDRLYVADGSVLPTQGSANPALTIMALAARLADTMIEHGRAG
jgi:choline dehydrogenase-like flavoprotein